MMNKEERELQIQKLKMIQMINTYLAGGLLALIVGVVFGFGYLIAEVIKLLF